jgi:5,10-methylenetetrahydrofolate reductase
MFCLRGEKHKRLYYEGKSRLEDDMDMVTLIKQMRRFSTLMDSSLLKSKVRKFEVDHSYPNVIDLDSDDGYKHTEERTENVGGDPGNTLFYFTKDFDVSKVKFFESDLRYDI